jgi:hypothetical protein
VGIVYRQPSFDRAFSKLSAEQQQSVRAVIGKIPSAFGKPHQHAGIGIRVIRGFYECRAGLKLRVLFLMDEGDFILVYVGDHNAIRAFIKNAD